MSRPVPLAITAFLLGVAIVAMLIAPRHYTADDFIYRNTQYAKNIRIDAELVANTDISLSVRLGAAAERRAQATTGPEAEGDTTSAPASATANTAPVTDTAAVTGVPAPATGSTPIPTGATDSTAPPPSTDTTAATPSTDTSAAVAASGSSVRMAPVSALDKLAATSGRAASAREPVDVSPTESGNSLVICLQNTGAAAAWGRLDCRIGSAGWRVSIPVEDLRPHMEEPVIFVIPLGGIILPEEGLTVTVRWAKLYTK